MQATNARWTYAPPRSADSTTAVDMPAPTPARHNSMAERARASGLTVEQLLMAAWVLCVDLQIDLVPRDAASKVAG